VNLFLVGWSAARAVDRAAPERTLRDLAARLPFFPGRPVERWAAPSGALAAAWVQHAPEDAGGAEYVHAEEERLALYSGRPFAWTGEASADGRRPLDPRFYVDGLETVADRLDGRFVALRYAERDRALEVLPDVLGAYPVYSAERDGVRWVSNSAEALRAAVGARELSLDSLAGLIGGGWPLDGHPMWAGVERLEPGLLHRFPGEPVRLFGPRDSAAMLSAGFSAERASSRARAAAGALAESGGRPNIVPVTGGRDSRVVLGAALAAGFSFETRTGGEPGHPDVEIGRALAEAAGVPHRLLEHDPHGSVAGDWRREAELLHLTQSGTASLSDAAGFPFGPRPGPLWLWHSGQGGEVARGYYGSGAGLDRGGLVDRVLRAFTARRPGRAGVLNEGGLSIVRAQIERFADEQLAAGATPEDGLDLFYLWRRMGAWAGPTHGAVEYVRDTTSPLWSRRLLEDELGLPAADRLREVFHLRVLEQLAPQLVDIPFEDGLPWPARQSALALRARRAGTFARKVRGELRRRVDARRTASIATAPPDPFATMLSEIRDAVLSLPDHPAWQLLDRPRTEALLRSDATALDTMSRYYAWRLATVFSAPQR
jgi:hypothetical protein